VYDKKSCSDDVGDEVTSDTFIKSGVVLVQVYNRQVTDFLERSRRRREHAVSLYNRNRAVVDLFMLCLLPLPLDRINDEMMMTMMMTTICNDLMCI